MKKRIVAAGLAALMVLSLAGCSKIQNAYELSDYSQYVTLGQYKGLDIEVDPIEVTDEQVQTKIDAIINSNSTTEQITDRTVESGDTINWDYSGTMSDEAVEARKQAILESSAEHVQVTDRAVEDGDTINMDFSGHNINDDGTMGDAFDNGTATGYTYTVGGNFISDLNDQLIGLECGKEYDLTCTFPDNYTADESLAGVTVIFVVTVNYIEGDVDTSTIPEWTDDFATTYSGGDYTTADDLEDSLRNMGSTTDASYSISGSGADGFDNALENQIVGSECGKEYTITVNFPDDYATYPEIAGMPVTVTYTVNYIEGETTYPEWNDAFVNEYSDGEYTTAAAYEQYIRDDLTSSAKSDQEEDYEAGVWAKVVENCPVSSYPEEEVQTNYERFYNSYKSNFEYYAAQYSMTYEEFLSSYGYYYMGISTDEELQSSCRDYAESWMNYAMISAEISKAENIVIPTEEFKAEEESLVESGNYDSVEALEEATTVEYLMEYFIYQKVTDWLVENNNMVETAAETSSETGASTETLAQTSADANVADTTTGEASETVSETTVTE